MRLILAALLLLCAMPAMAEAPLPARKDEKLKAFERDIEKGKTKQKELDTQAASLEKDLKGLKKELVNTASKVQKHEKNLQQTEEKITELKTEKEQLASDLEKDQKQMSDLLMALSRIQRLPPEALIARPGAPEQTAQAATLLSSIVPALHERAEILRKKLQKMQEVEENLTTNQKKLAETAKSLKEAEKNVKNLMAAREKAVQDTKQQLADQAKVVAQISKQAADFKDLIDKIEAKNKTLRDMAAKDTGVAGKIQPDKKRKAKNDAATAQAMADLPSLGAAQLPLSGIVRVRYGEADEIGAISEGVRIEGRPGSLIVAPMGGIVRYSGEFKKYGKIVLIEHKKNYHSLIAGLGKIDTFVGQSVDSGEPVGILGNSSGGASNGRAVLYYELRHNGQPINPAKKFGDLDS